MSGKAAETAPAPDRPPAGRPGIPFETEPVVAFHPLTAGATRPGAVQPGRGLQLEEEGPAARPGAVQPGPGPGLSLEEEPALWPDAGASPTPPPA